MHKIIYISFCCFFLMNGMLSAQDLKADIKESQHQYKDQDALSMKMNVTHLEDDKVKEVRKVHLRRKGNNYLYTLDHITLLVNERCKLMIDEEQKYIVLEETDEQFSLDAWSPPSVDSLLNHCSEVKFEGISDQQKKYTLFLIDQEPIIRADIFMNASTLLTEKVIYYYERYEGQKDTKVVLDFKEMNTKPNFDLQVFSEKQFLTKKGESLEPTAKYSTYQLFDTRTLSEDY